MKWLLLAIITAGPMLASCAHPLERVVDANREKRVGESLAGKPIIYGAGDGLGMMAARTADTRLTMSDRPHEH